MIERLSKPIPQEAIQSTPDKARNRFPLPPFKGPHRPGSIEKNKASNRGKKRSPDFGPRISQIMVEIWQREDYRKKREGKKRGSPSAKTRMKIGKSLEKRWESDENYQRRMLEIRGSRQWRERSKQTLTTLWTNSREKMLKASRKAALTRLRRKATVEKDRISERYLWKDIWVDFKKRGILSSLFNPIQIKRLDDFFKGKIEKTNGVNSHLDRLTIAAANKVA